MAIIKAFKGILARPDKVEKIATLPYDVVSSEEARKMAESNPLSFFHIIKSEIDFPADIDPYSSEVYEKGKSNFNQLLSNGDFIQDAHENLYIYELTAVDGRIQNGIVACAAVSDYFDGIIKKHELTRPDKENDRKKHVLDLEMNAEPVFFAYPGNSKLKELVSSIKEKEALFDFKAEDGIRHRFWRVEDASTIEQTIKEFELMPATYIADGHHRTAAAALAGKELDKTSGKPDGKAEHNYFLAVHFPDDELEIIDYNRVIKDLNGYSTVDFLNKLKNDFDISKSKAGQIRPSRPHDFGMYLEGQWYLLSAKDHAYNDDDPIDCLDVTVLTKSILSPILRINDLRTDKRISFVGGVRGLDELEKLVDEGLYKAAFSLYPVSMAQLMNIADNGLIMPPKTTWFEPKLRSGLVVHALK